MIIGISGEAGVGKDTVANVLVKDYNFVKIALADPIKRICKEIFDFSDEQLWGPSEKRNEPDKRYRRIPESVGAASIAELEDARILLELDRLVSGSDLPVMDADVDTMINQKHYLTPRYALQHIGDVGRKCYINVWVDYTMRIAKQVLKHGYGYSQQRGMSKEQMTGLNRYSGIVISDIRYQNELEASKKSGAKTIRIKSNHASLEGEAYNHSSEKEQRSIPDSCFDFVINNDGNHKELYEKVHVVMKKLL